VTRKRQSPRAKRRVERSVDLIAGTMEKDAEAVRKGLEKRGLDPAFYPQNFRYDPESNS